MCHTSAVGISSSMASTMPIPARRIGMSPTRGSSRAAVIGSSGVSIGSGRVARSAIAS